MSLLAAVARDSSVPIGTQGALRNLEATRDGALFVADWKHELVLRGKVWVANGPAANTSITTQTSFADTTPSFLLRIPSGTTAIPLHVKLDQTGTVAGASIGVEIARSGLTDAWASGGSTITPWNALSTTTTGNACTFLTGATATTALLINTIAAYWLAPSVTTGALENANVLWMPEKHGFPPYLVGPTSLGIFTYAGTTAPTWFYNVAWAELTTGTEIT